MSVNNVVLIGRLTKDVELKYSQSGVAMARFTLAVNRIKKTEGQPDADFIQILCFNKTAENVANFTSKGSQVAVTGSINTGSYEKDGQRIFTTDVIANSVQFLESKKENKQPQQQYQQMNQPQYNQNYQPQPLQQQYQQPTQQQQQFNPNDLPF